MRREFGARDTGLGAAESHTDQVLPLRGCNGYGEFSWEGQRLLHQGEFGGVIMINEKHGEGIGSGVDSKEIL
jgi:hypothetical protein